MMKKNLYSNIPYTYLIEWTHLNIRYYGVRYAKNCHPDEFWENDGYKTSSNYVNEFIKIHGDPDVKQIRKTFVGEHRNDKALLWEKRVLTKLNAASRLDYLNKHNGTGRPSMADPSVRKTHKEKMNTPEVKKRCRDSSNTELKKKNWKNPEIRTKRIDGIKKSLSDPVVKKKQSDAITLAVNTPESKLKKRNSLIKAWENPEIRERIISSRNNPESKNKIIDSNVNHTIFTFIHVTGIIEVCTQYDLRTKYGLNSGNLASVVFGKRKSCKGWSISTST